MKFFPSRKVSQSRSEMFATAPLRLQRDEQLDALGSDAFDILIVGGGVTGAYTALDASLRGYRVALVEKAILPPAPRRNRQKWFTAGCATLNRAI